ncbi:hypothetical protein CPS_0966 [Colwellia psychrerythraea 34H]|uniref:Uncharacterized protein n=1 Tax=Colwellia psychrerythraea (strain 34H / ATCC BAA-681) TaxID=167879 RepID=Q487Q0_COLP3|nr:hypothetical protein CPS_0966 [Colwellia psychrerythraea 34H]
MKILLVSLISEGYILMTIVVFIGGVRLNKSVAYT